MPADSPPHPQPPFPQKVIEYCKYHVENESDEGEASKATAEEMKAWDAKFVEVEQSTLFELILAANYLNIKVRGVGALPASTRGTTARAAHIQEHFRVWMQLFARACDPSIGVR